MLDRRVDPGAPKSALQDELRGRLPAVADRLEPDEITDLTAAIQEAKRAQAKELSDSADLALQHVPKLLRGAAKRVLLG
jgi:hypothetical protein